MALMDVLVHSPTVGDVRFGGGKYATRTRADLLLLLLWYLNHWPKILINKYMM